VNLAHVKNSALPLNERQTLLKLALDAYYNAIRPNAGNETWLLQATLTFIFPVPGSSGSRP
jgi:hypothetical protein